MEDRFIPKNSCGEEYKREREQDEYLGEIIIDKI